MSVPGANMQLLLECIVNTEVVFMRPSSYG